jgi:hypothetical protein
MLILRSAGPFGYDPSLGDLVGAFFSAATVGGIIFCLGILISALGQLMLATLDSAVHGSPFLDDEQKAEAMSL